MPEKPAIFFANHPSSCSRRTLQNLQIHLRCRDSYNEQDGRFPNNETRTIEHKIAQGDFTEDSL